MKIGALLRIEYLKTVKRRAFWVALAFLALLSTVTLVSELIQGRQGNGAPFVPPFTWGQTAASLGPLPMVFLALTVVMLVTSEFGWRTARQNVIDGLSKEQFFVAKWLMMAGVVVTFVATAFLIGTATAIYGRIAGATPSSVPAKADSAPPRAPAAAAIDSARQAAEALSAQQGSMTATDSARAAAARRADSAQAALRKAIRDLRDARPRPVYPAPDPSAPLVSLNEVKVALGYTLSGLGFATMAFMLAMLLRSTGGGIGVFFLYFAFLEQLIGLVIRRAAGAEVAQTIVPYLPVNALRGPMDARVWDPDFLARANAIATSVGQPVQTVTVDLWKLVGLPLAWIAVFTAVTFLVVRTRDL